MEFLAKLKTSFEKNQNLNAFCIAEKFYSYAELTQLISNIRAAITNKVKDSEKLIGLVANDDLETYASIFALWLEGKAYVPVNPLYPKERNLKILELTASKYIIDSSENSIYEQSLSVIKSIYLKNEEIKLEAKKIHPKDLAYILFTSGSTGVPKGVPISFENLTALLDALDKDPLFNLNATDKCLQMFELTFDFSLVTYLPPLFFGACVYTIPKDTIKYFYIYKLIQNQGLTVLTMVPSIIHYLRPYFKEINSATVRYCSFGGGKLYSDIAEEWSQCIPKSQIFNYYGPTEFTVYSGYYLYQAKTRTKNHNGVVSIGKTLNGVNYLVVDTKNNEVATSESGELCLSGDQLTQGYWKNEEKNNEVFFSKMENGKQVRYYKTGDLCFLDNEGDYMYVGRSDFQVKIRGYRVELGEIEYYVKNVILKKEIVVIDITNNLENTELALAIVAKTFDLTALREYLKEKLPEYMVPTKYAFFDELPHSLNGKINRSELRTKFKV
jgi:amino acid adenylation domain-containing protein